LANGIRATLEDGALCACRKGGVRSSRVRSLLAACSNDPQIALAHHRRERVSRPSTRKKRLSEYLDPDVICRLPNFLGIFTQTPIPNTKGRQVGGLCNASIIVSSGERHFVP